MTITITALLPTDWPVVSAIYAEGIATGQATFEAETPPWERWDAAHMAACRLVARQEGPAGPVVGWAALTPVSSRCAYAGVAEVSIYIATAVRGQGVGRQLLQALVTASEMEGIWTLQASIFPENTASLHLHAACGFREVGRRAQIAKLHGVWRDTVLMERRSTAVGID